MSFQIYLTHMVNGHVGTRVSVANSEEEFRNTTVQELKRKLIPEDQLENTILIYCFNTLEDDHTLGFYGIKHEDHIYAVPRGTTYSVTSVEICSAGNSSDDDDEDEVLPRTRSMDIMIPM